MYLVSEERTVTFLPSTIRVFLDLELTRCPLTYSYLVVVLSPFASVLTEEVFLPFLSYLTTTFVPSALVFVTVLVPFLPIFVSILSFT